MSRLLTGRQSTLRDAIKPLPMIREPKEDKTVEFRWSTTVIQYGLIDDPYHLNWEFDDTQEKSHFFPVLPNEKRSIHLPPIHTNQKAKLLPSSNRNSPQCLPLLIPYSRLTHPRKPPPPKTKTPRHYRSRETILHSDLSLSSNSTSPTSEKYIRLLSSQLRRLHVSNKYLKEAKTLYFNAASRVFVPRRPLVEVAPDFLE